MDRVVMPFNTDWLYRPEDRPSFARRSCSEKGFRRVSLPHANIELPWHNFDNAEYQFVSWYRKHFALPGELKGRRLFVRFDGVMIAAEVFVNGTKVASHKGGYVPSSVDITDHVTFGPRARNVMAVRVDSRERPDIPPYGGVADYLSFGGIYRDVWLTAVSPFFVADVFARPRDVLQEAKRLELSVALANESDAPRAGALTAELLDGRGRCLRRATSTEVEVSDRQVVELELTGLSRVKLWDLDSPEPLHGARHPVGGRPGARHHRGAAWLPPGGVHQGGAVPPERQGSQAVRPGPAPDLPPRGRRRSGPASEARRGNHEVGPRMQHRPHEPLPAVAPLPRPV